MVCCFISFCLFLSLFGVLFWFRVMFLVSHRNNLEWNIFQKCQRITYFCISETNWACIYYICHKRKITSTFEKHCPIMALDMYFCASSINKFEIMHALILKTWTTCDAKTLRLYCVPRSLGATPKEILVLKKLQYLPAYKNLFFQI